MGVTRHPVVISELGPYGGWASARQICLTVEESELLDSGGKLSDQRLIEISAASQVAFKRFMDLEVVDSRGVTCTKPS